MRARVLITEPMLKRYQALKAEGKTIAAAIKIVQAEFKMSIPHTNSAVQQKLTPGKYISKRKHTTTTQQVSTAIPETRTAVSVASNKIFGVDVDYDRLYDDWTLILAKARQASSLEDENYRLRNIVAAKNNQVKTLEENLKVVDEKKRRFDLAVQQGDIGNKENKTPDNN
jgi:hypothetical protein